MPDDILSGHPRTLLDHQDWRVRDIKKQNAASQQLAIAASNIKISDVVSVSEYGHVRLAAFTNEEGDGKWFSVLNRCIPMVGEYALYVMVDGNPVVLGTIPNDRDSRHFNEPRYFEHLEHFDVASIADNTQGGLGKYRWLYNASGGFILQKTTVDDYGFGWVRIHTGGTAGQYSTIFQRPAIYMPKRIREMEFGIVPGGLDQLSSVGLIDHLTGYTNGVYVGYDYSSIGGLKPATWSLAAANASVYTSYDTGLPVVAGHRYTVYMQNAGNNAWNAEVTDWDTAEVGTATVTGVAPSSACYLHAAVFDRVTNAQAKILDIDFVRWQIFDVDHGPLDIRD